MLSESLLPLESADLMKTTILEVIQNDCGIKISQVQSGTTDNESNYVSLFKKLDILRLACFIHIASLGRNLFQQFLSNTNKKIPKRIIEII